MLADTGDTVGEIMLNAPLLREIGTLAKIMSDNKVSVPKHLQGAPSDCYAVVLQAVQWRMNPFAVAQKTHIVSGALGYEAQLVNAVIQNSGMITGTFRYEFDGEGAKLRCRVGAVIRGDNDITWGEWLSVSDVTTKNSPLWKTNPRQQMAYLQVKNWSRLYAPGAILGVYTPDELRDIQPSEREVGPGPAQGEATGRQRSDDLADMLADDADDVAGASEETQVEPDEGAENEPSAQDGQPALTYAMVADAINKAPDQAALSELGNSDIPEFLHEGENGQYREELMDLYKARQQQLQAVEGRRRWRKSKA